jgi:2-succinyl-6-hydroxy-2,4-cyclohexadiene-1-carboxylate synthase
MRMVLVPGFTQGAASWDPVCKRLADDLDVDAIDVPTGLDFVATAAALADSGGRAIYVGYSMGGRLCLRIAVDHPELVRALVVISSSPGIADPAERANRRATDEQLAVEIERDGVDAFLERWLAQPLFASLPRRAADIDSRRQAHSVASLTHALRALGQGSQEPLWDRLAELTMPFVPVAGRLDEKYVAIAARMAEATGSHPVLVAGAGHAVHLEQPEVVVRMLQGVHHELES